jgi:hypothetical protein
MRGFVWKIFVQRHFGASVRGGRETWGSELQIFLGIGRSEGAPKIQPLKAKRPGKDRGALFYKGKSTTFLIFVKRNL